jgi:hypothetical protein
MPTSNAKTDTSIGLTPDKLPDLADDCFSEPASRVGNVEMGCSRLL